MKAPLQVDPGSGDRSLSERPRAIDLFCGAGGLTQGLRDAGFTVSGAVDISQVALGAYAANHPSTRIWAKDIRRLRPSEVMADLALRPGQLDLLAGCPPCQGFSTMRTRRKATSVEDGRNGLVAQFARFAEALRPRTLLMENVPGLLGDRRLLLVLARLRKLGYQLTVGVLDAQDFGVPQRRRRMVLLGSLEGAVGFARPSGERATVRDAIGALPRAGRSGDPLHDHGEKRTDAVRRLIAAVPLDGGSRSALGREQQLQCHRDSDGWSDVYGRMAWDRPAPTITSGCINPSKGRFLHPTANRAITLREAALLQTFPSSYVFPLDRGKYHVADLIGNALPPAFVSTQARELAEHLRRSSASGSEPSYAQA